MPETVRPASDASASADPDALLAPLRARAASRVARVRLRLVESLARRAAALDGDARCLVDDKLAALLASFEPDAAPATQPDPLPRSPLADLLGDVAHRSPARAKPTPVPKAVPAGQARPIAPIPLPATEPEALQYFRRTWSRLSADQRLAQSRSALPGNAGPLHSQHLVHRSLMLMHEVAPEYLERFLSHVDALLWLDRANAAGPTDAAASPRASTERRAQPAARAPRAARTKVDPQA
jgi:hypothetical protein